MRVGTWYNFHIWSDKKVCLLEIPDLWVEADFKITPDGAERESPYTVEVEPFGGGSKHPLPEWLTAEILKALEADGGFEADIHQAAWDQRHDQ